MNDYISYIKKITKLCADKRITYSEWGDKILGEDNVYSSENLRKAFYVFNKVIDKIDEDACVSSSEVLNELEELKDELYKERCKLQDANREKRNALREEARYENLIEVLKDALYDSKEVKFNEVKYDTDESSVGVLQLSDWHCGSLIDNQFNFYDIDTMIDRATKIRDKAIKYSLLHKVTDLVIEINGDMVDGLIHVSSRVQQEEDVIDQCVTVSNVLIEMINSMKPYYKSIKVVTTLGNHGRLVAGKAQCSTTENFEKLIPIRLRDNLKDVTVIDSHGLDFVKYEIGEKIIMLSHGQNDKLNNCIADFSKMFKVVPTEVHLGHTHSYKDINDCDVMVTVNGCLDGSDDYALSIRKVTKPSQNFIVYGGDRCIYKLDAE